MMTCSGYLVPSIIDFDKDAKYLIKAHYDPEHENWWSSETDGLTCYLQSTDSSDADRSNCYVILETNSRDEIAQAFERNCQRGKEEAYLKLKAHEETNAVCLADNPEHCNQWWELSEWAKVQREQGKHLMGYPGNIDDLIPLNKEAAKILIRVARFHFEDDDPEYVRIKNNCAEYL